MKIVELRIILPIALEQFDVADDYMILQRTMEESSGGEGIEFVSRDFYTTEDGRQGKHEHKIYHYKSRVPAWIRWAVPTSIADFHEEAYSTPPTTHLDYIIPFFGERFQFSIDSSAHAFTSIEDIDNPANLNEEELKIREVRYLDIIDSAPLPKEERRLGGFVCEAAGIQQLPPQGKEHDYKYPPKWVADYKGPMMFICKVLKTNVRIWGLQTRVENYIANSLVPGILLESARGIVYWAPDWAGMTPEDVKKLTDETFSKVNNMIEEAEKENNQEEEQNDKKE
ncbi:Phosphatidylinositol transfer protein [Histomonas meleagridis]|uniref:Phosphatidylinositol transfer protein n=1 Tax=Histomonas meleagridis TaxID=135588 RepID=UPI003559FFB4|nr:Phosphatidylinositol transfer protein [Histomonas meleagridis]KAH0803907.1 Phosphatidylinositol transfer protein [Histomonas meleagridis]